jgi:proteasome lid subunit RPN8/RPN11
MSWTISRRLMDRLLAEAKAAGPAEICGILLGREGSIAAALPAPNLAPDPAAGFALHPATQFEAARRAREAGLSVIGCYHSHPGGLGTPSPSDAEAAIEPERCWLILAGGEARLWRSRAGGSWWGAFEPVELKVADTPALQP